MEALAPYAILAVALIFGVVIGALLDRKRDRGGDHWP